MTKETRTVSEEEVLYEWQGYESKHRFVFERGHGVLLESQMEDGTWNAEFWGRKEINSLIDKIPKPTKGKKAVTFYIPEGMTIGEAISEAYFPMFNNSNDCPCNYRIDDIMLDFSLATQEQIQEAINKTYPQKDA